jgi:hypothetical protein
MPFVNRPHTSGAYWHTLWLLAVLAGCGRPSDEPVRAVVAGSVAYQQKPVAQGQIRFIPTKGSKGPLTVAEIVDGQYRVAAKGGVPVATQRVEILGFRPDPKYNGQEQNRPPMMSSVDWPPKLQYLPRKYNAESTLELVVEPGQGEIRRDFQLQ